MPYISVNTLFDQTTGSFFPMIFSSAVTTREKVIVILAAPNDYWLPDRSVYS